MADSEYLVKEEMGSVRNNVVALIVHKLLKLLAICAENVTN